MDQCLRDWYLATMGVVRYVPVRLSTASTDSVAAVARVPVPVAADAESAPSADSARAKSPADWPGAPESSVQALSSRGTETSLSEPPEPALTEHLRLAFWQPTVELAVLDSLAPMRRPQVAEQQLLENILKAIKHFPGELPAPEFIDWPPAPGASADLAGARVYLNMFLDGRRRQRPFSWLLVMGSAAARMLCVDAGPPVVGAKIALGCDATAICVPALSEMVEKPELKAGAWQAIRFLAGQA